jgi:hypothetical protein
MLAVRDVGFPVTTIRVEYGWAETPTGKVPVANTGRRAVEYVPVIVAACPA